MAALRLKFPVQLILILLLFCSLGHSQSAGTAAETLSSEMTNYAQVFEKSYPKYGVIYFPGQCGRNIKELLLELQKQNLEWQNTSVLFLLHETKQIAGGPFLPTSLSPAYSRENVQAWDFHVILKVVDAATKNHFILDLDGPMKVIRSEVF